MSFQIGDIKADPGERVNGYIEIAKWIDGTPIQVPAIVVNGVKPGKRLWALACEHADEISPIFYLLDVVKKIDPKKMSGTLICIPVLNPTAFNFGLRHSPIDYVDMEHQWPGKEIGFFTQRSTYNLFKIISNNADCVLNYHGGGFAKWEYIDHTLIETPPDAPKNISKENNNIAKAYGLEYIAEFPSNPEAWSGESALSQQGLHPMAPMLMPQLNLKAVPAISVLGGIGPKALPVRRHAQGIINVMTHLGIFGGKPKLLDEYTYLSGYSLIRPKNSGVFKSHVNAGDKIKQGDHLATIYNIFGETIEKIHSPVNGVVILKNAFPFINALEYECYAFEIYWLEW